MCVCNRMLTIWCVHCKVVYINLCFIFLLLLLDPRFKSLRLWVSWVSEGGRRRRRRGGLIDLSAAYTSSAKQLRLRLRLHPLVPSASCPAVLSVNQQIETFHQSRIKVRRKMRALTLLLHLVLLLLHFHFPMSNWIRDLLLLCRSSVALLFISSQFEKIYV